MHTHSPGEFQFNPEFPNEKCSLFYEIIKYVSPFIMQNAISCWCLPPGSPTKEEEGDRQSTPLLQLLHPTPCPPNSVWRDTSFQLRKKRQSKA